MNIHLWPTFAGEDEGDGGIRRVVEGQRTSLPRHGIKFVDDPGDADLIACHIEIPEEFLKRFPDKPFVSHCHGLYWSDYEWPDWSYKANRNVLRAVCSADVTTAPTEWVANVLRRHTSRDVRVVPHGVSFRDWQIPASHQHKGYVLWNKTRVDPVCEVDTLNALVRMSPEFEFVSTYADEAPNMTITGTVPYKTAKELVRSAGVYLCTTRETFGIGTLEAMACGVPVVAYNFGGQAEYIEHMKDGYLVPPGDIEGLRDGIRYALENRDAMGKAAQAKAEEFTWAKAVTGYKAIYRELVDKYDAQEHNPRVSFVVPAFKLEKYLPDTLASIAAQTEKDWECIVVDDASPDRCGVLADQWAMKDSRFKVIHNPENLYLAESRNVAIAQARGRYILPVDADDMITPTTAQVLADVLDGDRSLQAAYGNVLFVNEDGKTPTDYRVPVQTPGHSGWPMPMDPMKQVSGANLMPYASMYRRTAWENVGGYRRRLKTAEDADLWTRFASWGFRAEKVTDADTLIYRNREGSMSRTNGDRRYDYLRWFPWSKDSEIAPAGLLGQNGVALLPGHVTVVIPVGPGHARYVHDAVDSVAAQSYKYWDVVVVNDTGEPLPPLPSWVRVIPCDARDVSIARNLGVEQAKGSLYLPLDADDFLQPDALQWLVSAFIEKGGQSIIYPDFFEDPIQEGVFSPYRLPDWDCEHLTLRGTIATVTALTPVAAWRAVGGYTPGINWEDWDFQLKCAEKGICSVRLAAPLFTYRKWTGNRRSWDGADDFEERKKGILARWADYFEGRKQFMACGCAQGTVTPMAPETPAMAASRVQFGETVLVEYIGSKIGGVTYKGTSGKFYTFAKGDQPKFVAGEDAMMFSLLQGFRIIAEASGNEGRPEGEPVLSA